MKSEEHYTEVDNNELWDEWANRIAIEQPEIAEQIALGIIEAEGDEDGTETN